MSFETRESEQPVSLGVEENLRDYSDETQIHRSRVVRGLLVVAGSISLGLGILGIFLPLLPTTPFLLLSAACYARSSTRFYNWLMNNRYFGEYIRSWRQHRAIPRKAKVLAISLLVLTIGSSVLFFIPLWPVKLLVAGIGVAVAVYLLRMPTLESKVRVSTEEHVEMP